MKFSKDHLASVFLMVRAAFAFSVMALCVKLASPRVPSMEIVFTRSFLSVLVLVPLMKMNAIPVWGRHKAALVMRGVTGFLALSLHFYTIGRMPLGTAVLLNYSAPLFVVLFSAVFLKEKVRPMLAVLVCVCFAGLYLLLHGDAGGWNMNFFWGVLSAVFSAIAYVTIASLKGRESSLTIIFYFTLVSTLGSLPFLFRSFQWPGTGDLLALLGVAAGAFWGQLWMTRALRRAPASFVSPFSYLTPLLSFLYGLFFWGETLSPASLTGMILILGGGSLLSYWGARDESTCPTQE
ncbi:MAG TPA: DMT family transporter [Verrucomicrobiae bacterium]|jgi:drug/metabolite transporter (DMT)-like permease|nr:DMT family transporter [Verrucomicrobiae bacterium]